MSLFARRFLGAPAAARSFSTSAPRSIARISIIGNLGDTPETHQTSSGRELVKYSVASSSGPRDNRQTSWFRVTSFADGPRRELLTSLPKGTLVLVEGTMTVSTYQDANGQTRTNYGIVQRNIDILRRPSQHSEGGNEGQAPAASEGME